MLPDQPTRFRSFWQRIEEALDLPDSRFLSMIAIPFRFHECPRDRPLPMSDILFGFPRQGHMDSAIASKSPFPVLYHKITQGEKPLSVLHKNGLFVYSHSFTQRESFHDAVRLCFNSAAG